MMPLVPVSCKPASPAPRIIRCKKPKEIKGLPSPAAHGATPAPRGAFQGQAVFHKVSLFIAAQGCN
jgi:hypothetical protein